MLTAALALLKRDLSLSLTRAGGPWLSVGFYIVLTALIPLSLGPDQVMLSRIAPGLAFLALALTSFLALERLFERDHEEGVFDLLRLGPLPLEVVALLKMLAHWIGAGVVLSLTTPVVMIVLGADPVVGLAGGLAALIASLSFSLIGGIGASLSLGSRRGGGLLALLVLPLYIPPVIFGSGFLGAMAAGTDPLPALGLLSAFSLFALAIAPIAAGMGLRAALD